MLSDMDVILKKKNTFTFFLDYKRNNHWEKFRKIHTQKKIICNSPTEGEPLLTFLHAVMFL